MVPASIEQIRAAVGGCLVGPAATTARISLICHDSRQAVVPGCLFVALAGEQFDGHDFLQRAVAAGAAAALVHRLPESPPDGLCLIVVDDTRKALGRLAHWARQFLRGRVIAVGGSNGKTGTKGLIHAALAGGRLRGTASLKSYNNDLGVPFAILPADPADDYLILEMGTNHHGELRPLSEMAEPDVAVITSISAEHLEGLGDLDGVRKEEATIIAGLKPGGLLVVNGDDEPLLRQLAGSPAKLITFGFGVQNNLRVADLRMDEKGVRFRCQSGVSPGRDFFLPLLGRHAAANALAAIAVARHMNVNDDDIAAGLASVLAPAMRLQLRRAGGLRILNDAYNANPASMQSALDILSALSCDGRRLAVLGEMRELGLASDEAHREMGRHVARQPIDHLICVAPQARLIAEAAIAAGLPPSAVSCCFDSAAAALIVRDLVQDGDLVLLKGSRGVRLELVEQALIPRRSIVPGESQPYRC